jgi:hypothetical protein
VPEGGAWTTGRVVFEYRDEGAGTVRWFAADLQILSGLPAGSAAPPRAPSPAPSVASSDAPSPR